MIFIRNYLIAVVICAPLVSTPAVHLHLVVDINLLEIFEDKDLLGHLTTNCCEKYMKS